MDTVENTVLSPEQALACFNVLHRVAQLQYEDPLAEVEVTKPLSQDIQDCVDFGWLMTWDSSGEKARLLIRPEGRAMYSKWCAVLADAGTPVAPCYVREFPID